LASGTNILNADNKFLNNNFSYNGTTITAFPILANTYNGTAWNLYYDTSTTRIAYCNYSGEWIDLPDDFNFIFVSILKHPVVIQPIPFCVQTNLNCMNSALTQKDNKRFNSGGNVTKLSKSMRYSQVQNMPKNRICLAQPPVVIPVVENTISKFKSLKLINNLVTKFSLPLNPGSQINGQYIACSYNGQYVTIVCKSDIASGNNYGIFLSNNYGDSFTPVTSNQINYSLNTFNMHSVSVSQSGKYQFVVSNGETSSSIGVYYTNNYGATWSRFLYPSINGIVTNNLRWSQCTSISPSGQYMFAGGGGSGDGFDGGIGSGIGGWYDFYSNDYGASWHVTDSISDRISCTMNTNTFDVISIVNFNSTNNSFPGKLLKTNQTKYPILETTIPHPDSNNRPFRITSDNNSNVFMITVNNINHQNSNNIPDKNQDFINPTTPMYGYYSSNFGNTFGNAIVLPDAFISIAYNFSGSRLWACTHTTVYYSKNNGTSWYTLLTNISDIYNMTLSKDGLHLYLIEQIPVNNSGNNIYRANVSAF